MWLLLLSCMRQCPLIWKPIFFCSSNPKNTRIRKALENRTNMEDDRVAILEAQVAQAKLIAEEADKKYEEV